MIQPAIDLAEKGFQVPTTLHLNLRSALKRLSENKEANRICSGNGTAPAMGTVLKQSDCGDPQTYSRQGKDGFYKGKTAE